MRVLASVVCRQHPCIPPVLGVNFFNHNVGLFGLLGQDPLKVFCYLGNEPPFLFLSDSVSGDCNVNEWHRWFGFTCQPNALDGIVTRMDSRCHGALNNCRFRNTNR